MKKHMQSNELSLRELLSRYSFVIPVYQRPYGWQFQQCESLWLDLLDLSFPNGNAFEFDKDKAWHFLGSVLTHINANGHDDLIDGQQRTTTILLLLRALYEKLPDDSPRRRQIEECIWNQDEHGAIDKTSLKLRPEIALAEDNDVLKHILSRGTPKTNVKSKKNLNPYDNNYRYFQSAIMLRNSADIELLTTCLLDYMTVNLTRTTSTLEHAMRTYSRANDSSKGLQLTYADVFKAELYKATVDQTDENAKAAFAEDWGRRDTRCKKIFPKPKKLSPLEFAFLTYTYKEDLPQYRLSLINFYGKDNFAVFKDPMTIKDIDALISFFEDLYNKNPLSFSRDVYHKAYILLRMDKSFIYHALSRYFLKHRDASGNLDDKKFAGFLDRFTAFILGAVISDKLRDYSPAQGFYHISRLVDGVEDLPQDAYFSKSLIAYNLRNPLPQNKWKQIATVILQWWTFKDPAQRQVPVTAKLEVEHILAQALAERLPLENPQCVQYLGNLALLEADLNKHAKDAPFTDKKKSYVGYTNGKTHEGTFNCELKALAQTKDDFTEPDIIERNEQMIAAILAELDKHHLIRR